MRRSQAEFTLYTASAGAGKTYNLVFKVLRLCLAHPRSSVFRSILAITFTNKAAAEMKGRVIQTLEAFTREDVDPKNRPQFDQLCNELGLTEEELKTRSYELLRTILHHYSAFSISTIDRFTNRLIRTFAQDLKLSGHYEVELDSELILSEAIDAMLSDLEEDSAMAEVLIEFLNAQLEEGKSPRAEYRLLEIGFTLFEENAIVPLALLKELESRDFIKIQQKLLERNRQWEQQAVQKVKSILHVIDHNHIDYDLFSGGYLPKYLMGVVENPELAFPNATVQKQLLGEKSFYARNKAAIAAPQIDPVAPQIMQQGEELLQFISDHAAEYELSKLILRNIFSLAVVASIKKYLDQLKKESNRLPIGEFNQLISNHLQDQPAAFLYERIGERYRHYFVDEFQDTSRLQWYNLLPLANNTMAQNGSVMLVGDAKQSIYRWRGGEVEQFLDLSNDRDSSNKVRQGEKTQALYERKTVLLNDNWRSKSEIVNFNNLFFEQVVAIEDQSGYKVGNPLHRELFGQAKQGIKAGKGGYVSLQILPAAENEEEYVQRQAQAVVMKVEEAREDGFELRDICILSRSKKYNGALSEVLSANNIGVVSSDSLLLGRSEKVKVLMAFLKLALRPDDQWARVYFLEWYWATNQESLPEQEPYAFIQRWVGEKIESWREFLISSWKDFNWDQFLNLSLVNKLLLSIEGLGFNLQREPFLQGLMDHALDFEDNKEEGEAGFLRWWEMKGETISIEMPEELNAVRLMTIHKAKGLEFPVLILAFADWLAFREPRPSSAWMALPQERFFDLPVARLGLNGMESKNGVRDLPGMQEYIGIYQKNREDVALDNLNLLYVALTRAEERLHILGNYRKRGDSERITAYLSYFIDKQGDGVDEWTAGNRTSKGRSDSAPTSEPSFHPYQSVSWQQRLEVVIDSPKNWEAGEKAHTQWGKKVHSLLALVNTADDLGPALNKLESRGYILSSEKGRLKDLGEAVVNHPELKHYFGKDYRILNEAEILLPGSKALRPDRLAVEEGRVHIIDYKTGQASASHQQQVNHYAEIMEQQGLVVGDKTLVYLNEPLQVVKW